jgi:hypothetical protein
MPLGRYFLFTTSLLLALLFLSDRYMPEIPLEPMHADIDRSIIRIHSGHKWPDAIVIDTRLPTITPPQAIASDVPTDQQARNAFARILQPPSSPRSEPSVRETKRVGSRHLAKTARGAVRHVASYQSTDLRTVPTGW